VISVLYSDKRFYCIDLQMLKHPYICRMKPTLIMRSDFFKCVVEFTL
jgi:hypothetical protein